MSSSVRRLTDQAHDTYPKPNWKCTFGYQRTLSILKRAEMCGQILGHLSNNRRNRGDIANWARDHIYRRKINIIFPLPKDPDAALYQRFMRWIFIKNLLVSNCVVHAIDSISYKEKKGYHNPGFRRFVLWLIYQAFEYLLPNLRSRGKLAEIMIMTPYLYQMHHYRDEIAELTRSGIIKHKIIVVMQFLVYNTKDKI
ncbi:PPAR-alpha interacting complex protein 285 [Colletotrichum tofieldiae]|nr:PPAR-alpha interacting complex protein 285 [Colletotrichum tofieldiae]